MKHTKVGTVMMDDVVTAQYGTGFKEITRLLAEHRISGLPVVDDDEKVIGVISETDLMFRQAATPEPGAREPRRGLSWLSRSGRSAAAKARARTAGMLMSAPAVTVHADESIASAARTMAQHRIERLPVVDEEDRLVGIVTRRDLLQVFLRPDEDIRREVVDQVIVGALWLSPQTIDVSVYEGVVTLHGQVERASEKPIILKLTSRIDGVVAVVDQLTYRLDDSHLHPAEQSLHGVTEDWLRKL
ncbi:CBS domain-containing protein [Streptomyces sp. B4I13]|uniref:CBS domain-containing protein n=1 Tax=Streptomyces sp. B4I13 TaxID=3042271 RepID=UPI00277D9EC4|nr:CBS domain-containing protein [Streptomyces sp. B4I13]MDQ0958113.1 CBS domain-containing protein [Streptomyces sp. B4I13]